MAAPRPYPATPRWVKVSGIIAICLVLLFVGAMVAGVGGPHGPMRHLPSGDAGGIETPAGTGGDTAPAGTP